MSSPSQHATQNPEKQLFHDALLFFRLSPAGIADIAERRNAFTDSAASPEKRAANRLGFDFE
jgi:hypothetical protein